MGLGSHMQTSDRAIAPDTMETGLRFVPGLFFRSESTTAQAGLSGTALAFLLGTTIAETCTSRATGGTGNPSRIALMNLGGVA
ncbi:hypothetical protein AAIH25_11095 [Arthrobacter crystallopoietes]|uniref:hypothetical protein n=1 Tax=Micrococcaceae TaxID=1268 RepID=UPI0021C83CE0|nr:hypothetical protein [Arthrobacter sp. Marseille-P9274]